MHGNWWKLWKTKEVLALWWGASWSHPPCALIYSCCWATDRLSRSTYTTLNLMNLLFSRPITIQGGCDSVECNQLWPILKGPVHPLVSALKLNQNWGLTCMSITELQELHMWVCIPSSTRQARTCVWRPLCGLATWFCKQCTVCCKLPLFFLSYTCLYKSQLLNLCSGTYATGS